MLKLEGKKAREFTKKKPRIIGFMPRRILCALFIGLSHLAVAGSASAQDPAHQYSKRAGTAINQAIAYADKGEHQNALDVLQVELAGNELSPEEFASIYQMVGQYSYELGDITLAMSSFESAISSRGLKPRDAENLKLVIGQLMIGDGQYREGAERIETYLNAGGRPNPQYIELLVSAWVQTEDYPRALPWAEKWYETAEPKLRRHYDLLSFLYGELGMLGAQQKVNQERLDQGL